MTVYIKVKKRFGITERGWKAGDQSIHYFEPGVYEVDDGFAKNPYVMENSQRIAAPDDRIAPPEPDNSTINAANEVGSL